MPAPITILGTAPPTASAIAVAMPMVESPASGWDTMTERLWLPHPYYIARGATRTGPEGGTFIVQEMRTVEWRGNRPIVELTSLGIAEVGGKDYKCECSGGLGEDLSLASGIYLSPTIWRVGYYRVTKLWVSLTTPAVGAHVGLNYDPPERFGLPSGGWSIAWAAADNWAAIGWVGETRNVQQLPGSVASLVTDTWLFDPGYLDRDGVAPGIIYL